MGFSKMRVVILAMGLAMTAGAALAGEPSTAIASAPKAEKEKVICKERVKANSRFTSRTCMTESEWAAAAETARSAFSEVQNRPMINITRSN